MWYVLKRLMGELAPYRKLVIIMAVAGVVMSLAQWQLAVRLKDLFDALGSKNSNEIFKIPKIIMGTTLFMVIGRYIHLSIMNYLADLVTMRFRHQLQWKFMTLNQSFHLQYQGGSGGLISRILGDVVSIQHGMRLVADFFTQPLAFVLLMGTLFYRDAKLTFLILIVLPPLLWFLRQVGRSLRKYGHGSQQILERVATIVKESLDGMRVIQSFGLESEMNRRFQAAANDYLATRKRIHLRAELTSPVTEFIATGVTMVIFTYIGMQISKGHATFGDFGSYLGALMMLQSPIKKFQESFVKVQETVVSLERVYSIIDDESYVDEGNSSESFPKNWNEINYHKVGFRYQDSMVLQDINLTINRGEVIAIVGESGSGKSTLVNLLQRFFDPTMGEVQIDGVDIRSFKLKELRRNIGLVTQDVFLFSESVGRNIHSGDFSADGSGLTAAAMTANAHDFISKMPQAYDSPVGDKGGFLSGGEKQRVSIARALFKNAPILILDEATSALDSASEVEVQKGLERLMQGKTTIVIAHRLSTVLHANKIIVMKQGRIIEVGSHVELLSRGGEYSRFIQLQNLK
jgi:ATP-binding cassette subfamily B protein/subfamily B ATP-binding cassette protein MsbA